MFNIIQKRKYWYIFSALILVPSIVAILLGGLKLGIDFTGGSLIRVDFADSQPTVVEIEESLVAIEDIGSIKAQPYGDTEMTIRLRNIDNDTYQSVLTTLRADFTNVDEKSFESIGPTIGQELKEKAIIAIILVLVFIVLYTSFAFRKSGSAKVKPWVYGLGTLVALFHDIIIVVGVFAILGKFWNVEIDILFITALLTILGFSVHDTIVVYDRVREKLKDSYNDTFEETVNKSVNQTLVRSVNTSLTTLLVLVALYLFGGQSISQFVLALIIGIIAGTYSSIFIASPFLVTWQKITDK